MSKEMSKEIKLTENGNEIRTGYIGSFEYDNKYDKINIQLNDNGKSIKISISDKIKISDKEFKLDTVKAKLAEEFCNKYFDMEFKDVKKLKEEDLENMECLNNEITYYLNPSNDFANAFDEKGFVKKEYAKITKLIAGKQKAKINDILITPEQFSIEFDIENGEFCKKFQIMSFLRLRKEWVIDDAKARKAYINMLSLFGSLDPLKEFEELNISYKYDQMQTPAKTKFITIIECRECEDRVQEFFEYMNSINKTEKNITLEEIQEYIDRISPKEEVDDEVVVEETKEEVTEETPY